MALHMHSTQRHGLQRAWLKHGPKTRAWLQAKRGSEGSTVPSLQKGVASGPSPFPAHSWRLQYIFMYVLIDSEGVMMNFNKLYINVQEVNMSTGFQQIHIQCWGQHTVGLLVPTSLKPLRTSTW